MPSKTENSETIAHRLVGILRLLNEGKKLDPKALVAQFGVTPRTIQRDLNERFAFLGLDKVDGCYSLNRARLGTLSVQDVERFATLAGLQGLHPNLSTDFLRELLESQVQSALLIRGHNYEDLSGKTHLFEQLRQAIDAQRPVGFEYSKFTGPKMVEAAQPYKLVNQEGIWYLAATDAGHLKSYAVSKISRLLVAPDTFTPDPLVLRTLAKEDSVWLNLNKTEVVLKIAPPAASYFQRRKLISNQKIDKELEDGGLIVSGSIAHANQILPIVRYWLPHIRIINPESLQSELEMQLQAYLRKV